jgi:hypothetical protein
MNIVRWFKQLTTPPGSTQLLIPVSNLVDAMDGSHAHKCRECALYFHLSPFGLATCPRCKSRHIFHIESWLRTPGEQVAHSASRRSTRFVKGINGGVPKPILRTMPPIPPTDTGAA